MDPHNLTALGTGHGRGMIMPVVLPARHGADNDIDGAMSMLGIAGDGQPPLGGAGPVAIVGTGTVHPYVGGLPDETVTSVRQTLSAPAGLVGTGATPSPSITPTSSRSHSRSRSRSPRPNVVLTTALNATLAQTGASSALLQQQLHQQQGAHALEGLWLGALGRSPYC